MAAAVYFGRKYCVETLIESGAEVNLKLENGLFGSALRASQTDVSQEDSMWIYDREEHWREEAEVAEILQHHGAAF